MPGAGGRPGSSARGHPGVRYGGHRLVTGAGVLAGRQRPAPCAPALRRRTRLFRSESGRVVLPTAYHHVWRRTRPLALTPAQVVSPLARRPCDLRHGGVSLRLNAGVPASQVAEWAGHSVEVLLTIYAKCIHGRDQVWFDRIDRSLDGDE
jgi:integrase